MHDQIATLLTWDGINEPSEEIKSRRAQLAQLQTLRPAHIQMRDAKGKLDRAKKKLEAASEERKELERSIKELHVEEAKLQCEVERMEEEVKRVASEVGVVAVDKAAEPTFDTILPRSVLDNPSNAGDLAALNGMFLKLRATIPPTPTVGLVPSVLGAPPPADGSAGGGGDQWELDELDELMEAATAAPEGEEGDAENSADAKRARLQAVLAQRAAKRRRGQEL